MAPFTASNVRSISSGRHWVKTWIATSSGTAPPSMIERTKSKSVCDDEGKATSISLKPMFTSSRNMRFLRSTPIGSISAWLPSRRSTEHQIGALSMILEGHWRSGRTIGWNARYFAMGMAVMTNPGKLLRPSAGPRRLEMAFFLEEIEGEAVRPGALRAPGK